MIKGQDLIPFREQIFDKRPPDALPPDWNDLVYLFDHIENRLYDGFHILEFGSGCSTVIIGSLINLCTSWNNIKFNSLESDIYWYDEMILKEGWIIDYNVWHSPVERIYKHNTWCFRYTNRPVIPVDFIYLDGPELTDQIKVTYDPIDYEPLFRKGFTMIVDGRHETVEFLRKHLKRDYIVRNIDGIDSTLFELND